MMTSRSALVCLVLLCSCKGGDEAAWAMQHATITASSDGLEGYQVWEFYGSKWKKKRNEKHHICARVQEVGGEGIAAEACEDCDLLFAVAVDELETDCEGDEGSRAGFGGMSHYGFGPLPSRLEGDDPHPGHSLAWYVSWDGESFDLLGWAYNEALDRDGEVEGEGWEADERYVLWPAFAWEL